MNGSSYRFAAGGRGYAAEPIGNTAPLGAAHAPVPARRRPARAASGGRRGVLRRARRRRGPRLGRRLLAAAPAPVVLGLAGAGALGAVADGGALAAVGDAVLSGLAGSGPASTPRSAWRAGEVPELYQTDPAWAAEPYAGGTVGENGCGPTCLTMAYVALTGRDDMTPADMAAFAERGGYTVDGMTAWSFMTEGAAQLGLTSEELPADASQVRAALEAGSVVIASVRPGDFTTTGHFIVLAGLAEDGTVIAHDPNSAERTHTTWDIERVLGQASNLWALGS